MDEISTIGLDIAKSVFQVHAADAAGAVVLRRQLRRDDVVKFFAGLPRCLVAMEACGSAHYWARQIGGLVPGQHSTGGKQRLGRITKTGDRYLRRLLVVGATGLVRYKRNNVPGGLDWLTHLLARKPVRLVTVALANKMARIAWAVLCRGEDYHQAVIQTA